MKDVDDSHVIDFCPSIWFHPTEETSGKNICGFLSWKVCFLCICLPMCYPCYLTREVKDTRSQRRRRRRNSISQSIIREPLRRNKQEEPEKETHNIKVVFIQSKSSEKLLKDLKNYTPSCESINPIPIRTSIHVNSRNEAEDVVAKFQSEIPIRRKRTFKKVSENLLFLSLLSKKKQTHKLKAEEEETLSYFSARSTNSGAFFTARTSFCSSAEEENISLSARLPNVIISPPDTTDNIQTDYLEAVDTKKAESKQINVDIDKEDQAERSLNIDITTFVDSSSYRVMLCGESLESENDEKVIHNLVSGTDILAVVFSGHEELVTVMKTMTGVMGYIASYWTGYFPLLLIQTCSDLSPPDTLDQDLTEEILSHFSYLHLVHLDQEDQTSTLSSLVVRYHIHLEKCGKGDQRMKEHRLSDWKCPGLCGLEYQMPIKREEKDKKRTFIRAVRKSMSVRKAVQANA